MSSFLVACTDTVTDLVSAHRSRNAAHSGARGGTMTEMTDLEGKGAASGDEYSPTIAAI